MGNRPDPLFQAALALLPAFAAEPVEPDEFVVAAIAAESALGLDERAAGLRVTIGEEPSLPAQTTMGLHILRAVAGFLQRFLFTTWCSP